MCNAWPMQLKGLNLLDPGAARLITKLLHKDPAERWSADKCLSSNFFQLKEDTTSAKADSGAHARIRPADEPKWQARIVRFPHEGQSGRWSQPPAQRTVW